MPCMLSEILFKWFNDFHEHVCWINLKCKNIVYFRYWHAMQLCANGPLVTVLWPVGIVCSDCRYKRGVKIFVKCNYHTVIWQKQPIKIWKWIIMVIFYCLYFYQQMHVLYTPTLVNHNKNPFVKHSRKVTFKDLQHLSWSLCGQSITSPEYFTSYT